MPIFARLSRRRFLVLTGATAAHAALYAAPTLPTPARAGAQSLAGEWRFSLDREDSGVKESWFSRELPDTARISLPGILQSQGYGDEITAETQFVAALPREQCREARTFHWEASRQTSPNSTPRRNTSWAFSTSAP